MKQIFYLLLILCNQLFSQEQWEIDMIEEDSEYHFDYGIQIYHIAQNIIEFDTQIKQLDTTSYRDKLKHEILTEQRSQVLTHALWEFDRILKYYPTSSLVNQTIFNKAQIHHKLGQIDSARHYYLALVEKPIPTKLDTSHLVDILNDAYSNLKNTAYKKLSELEYEQGNYQQSITYLNKSADIGYKHYCGNEHASNHIYMAVSYAKNYYELDSLDKSIEILTPHIFYNGVASHTEAAEFALKCMLAQYDREYLIAELEKGFSQYIKKKSRPTSRSNKYFLDFLGQEIQLFMYEPEDLKEEKKTVKEVIESEYFYQLLTKKMPPDHR